MFKNKKDHATKKILNQDILAEFKIIKTSDIVLLLDPILRYICCGKSIFDCCLRFKEQNEILEKVEAKFVNELSVI